MARLPRLNLPNIPQHVVQRGNNRQVTFATDDDYIVYLNKLKSYGINGVGSMGSELLIYRILLNR
ncbi:hypothetical protein [Psychrosphaera sp. F3M07]|uniref:hypothetical protein n=1 Tax=Psychrosphaera sp. F3M07 TaxID=2841560 RepID=UPI0020901268|nr:hypothetical protein [Psychrosphaera sp. F3M07]